jgi:formamidase|tara:strand:+ start:61 stop:1005 length:945 start_codon:yes stop_codon:yes gene_type:complete
MSSEHLSYTIHSHQHHFGWDNSIEPIIFSKSGDLIEVDTVDSSGSQLSQNSTINDVSTLDFSKVNPVTGPIYIHDAKQGDTIEVEIIDFHSSGWGWTAIIPGFGLLNDIFNKPDLHIWKYDKYNLSDALFSDFAKIPLSPFVGTIGLSLKEKGLHSIVPPRNCGGNIDIKNLTKGSKLYLPVQVDGGLLSLGDTHAAQGDGEVCGTAIESPMKVVIKIKLLKNILINSPQLETFSTNNIIDQKGHFIVTGIGPDLFESSKNAVQEMIELLVKKINITPSNAYMLCSVCADLKISEIVDIPNFVVTCHLPKYIFD